MSQQNIDEFQDKFGEEMENQKVTLINYIKQKKKSRKYPEISNEPTYNFQKAFPNNGKQQEKS